MIFNYFIAGIAMIGLMFIDLVTGIFYLYIKYKHKPYHAIVNDCTTLYGLKGVYTSYTLAHYVVIY